MVLKELMRRQSISTTEKYCVWQNAAQTATFLAGLMRPAVTNSNAGTAELSVRGDT